MKKNNFKLQYSRFRFDDKPADFDKRTQQWKQYYEAMVTIDDFAAIVEDGRCWRNAIYNAPRFRKADAAGSQILALDFDYSSETPEHIADYAYSLGWPANFYYWSFSQNKKIKNNFRVVWVLDTFLEKDQWEAAISLIYDNFKQFDGVDNSVKDISRMWYGTCNTSIILNRELLDVKKLHLEKVKIKPKMKALTPSTKKIIYNWELVLDQYCELWKKFKRGEYLTRPQRMLLISNLCHLNGAYDRILQIVDWDVYEKENSSFSIGQINEWFRQVDEGVLKQARIIQKGKEVYSTDEYFMGQLF